MMKRILCLLLICLLLVGCHPSTAVILPPATTAPKGDSDSNGFTATDFVPEDLTASNSSDPSETTQSSLQTQDTDPTSTQTLPQEQDQQEETKQQKQNTTSKKETVPPATSASGPSSAEQTDPSEASEDNAAAEATPEPTEIKHPVYDISNHSVSSTEKAIISEINRVRAENDLSELTLDKKLCALAAIRAYECSIDLGSTRPDGRSWKTVLSDYSYGRRSENAELRLHASGSYNAELLVITWMNTTNQREKLLDPQFTHVGIGTFNNGSKTYIVALFAA